MNIGTMSVDTSQYQYVHPSGEPYSYWIEGGLYETLAFKSTL